MFGIFEDDFPFPQVGYVNFLKGNVHQKVSCTTFGCIKPLHTESEELPNSTDAVGFFLQTVPFFISGTFC